ncbi:MAG: hypothetical protein AABW67_00705 [Nanoarchaeota archaeon]
MDYPVEKYKEKRKCALETYEPEKRIGLKKEHTFPILMRVGHSLFGLGGFISFWAMSGLMVIKGIFGMKTTFRKLDRFRFEDRIIEIKVRKDKR